MKRSLLDRSGVDYLWIIVMLYQLFGLSFWRHPFTAEDPLVSKWCNATILKICSSWWNKLNYILEGLQVEYIFRKFLDESILKVFLQLRILRIFLALL